jgi:hypothetical protein
MKYKAEVEYYMRRKDRYYFRGKGVKFSFDVTDKIALNKVGLKYGAKKLIEIETK